MRPRPLPEGTKSDIMKLLSKQELSAQSLAEILRVSGAAIRQHLETLNALGLVSRRKVVTRPCRPTFLYRLSRRGAEAFPKRYDVLVTLFADVIRERGGTNALTDVVEAGAERLAAQRRNDFESVDAQSRWDSLIEWLETEFAWQADIVVGEDGARRIRTHQCPFHAVTRRLPTICEVFFRTLIRRLYEPVRVDHVPLSDGVGCCDFLVHNKIA
jgi:predicted ArsR family transcriptional regulator